MVLTPPVRLKGSCFFLLMLFLADVGQLWIGLHDTNLQMDFQWTDHTPVIFTFWHPFEPNNFRNTPEDCVSLWGAVSEHTLTLGALTPPPRWGVLNSCALSVLFLLAAPGRAGGPLG